MNKNKNLLFKFEPLKPIVDKYFMMENTQNTDISSV